MDLTTNGVVITDAIKYVNARMYHLNNQEKEILQEIRQKDKATGEEEMEDTSEELETQQQEQETHNGIF